MTTLRKRISADIGPEEHRELKAILARREITISDWMRERVEAVLAIHRKFEEDAKAKQHDESTTK